MNSPDSLATPTTPTAGYRRGRRLYTWMSVVIGCLVFAGFARTFYLRGLFPNKPLTPLVLFHGILFTTWIIIFITQVRLIAKGRTDIHRKLGVFAACVAVLMPIVGTLAAIASAKRGFTPPGGPPPLTFLAIPLSDMVVFSVLVGFALYFRNRSDFHRRLMLLTTLSLMTPAIARIPMIRPYGIPAFFGIVDLLILSSLFWDRFRRGRYHPAFLYGGFFIILSQPARLILSKTYAWHRIAEILTR